MLDTIKLLLLSALALAVATPLHAQVQPASLDSLIASALPNHPALQAAAARLDAARARVRPAGALPDPMLMAGIENLPLGREALAESGGHAPMPAPESDRPDMMTMKMVGISQVVPFPGKLSARRRAAEEQVVSAEAQMVGTRWRIVREISHAYLELVYLERALQLVRTAHQISEDTERAAHARYLAGTGDQRGVLDARVATARFAERAVALEEERRIQQAVLGAAAGDSVGTDRLRAIIPERIARAVLPPNAAAVRFTSAEVGARAAGSSLPSVGDVQELAVRNNPELRARAAEIAALSFELEVARKDYLPDFDLSLRYGQRNSRPDMISATLAIPIPIQKGRKQDELVRAANAELAAARAGLSDETNRVRAQVAGLHAELERIRTQLALFSRSIIPQSQAAVASATASLQTGRIELFTVLERQTDLLEYQLEVERLLADFGQKLTQLESVAGAEVLP
jgi:outer membrane protein TolC